MSHPQLDLDQAIRPGLDILANEIVIALKKRTRFARNPEVYAPGLVRSDPSISLLHHVLGRVERVHAELGRFTYASQESYTPLGAVEPIIVRPAPSNPIDPSHTNTGARVIDFYRGWIRGACRAGSDPDSYGETVTADVDALLAILERINLGKYVAESKLTDDEPSFRDAARDRGAIIELIVKPDREAKVLDMARRLAGHYEVAPQHIVPVFEWMIEATIDIEVAYIRRRLGVDELAGGPSGPGPHTA